jgi:anaerobic magnesium-protoporphyrin IX monomethyl ester cyclase
VDMDKGTVLDYPNLRAEELLYWQKRAFREWAFRPAPMLTYLKMLLSDWSTVKSALSVGLQHLSWASTDTGAPIAGQLTSKLGIEPGSE